MLSLGVQKEVKARPYWHVDAKWICGLLLGALLVATLPVAVAYKLTERDAATNIIAYAMAGFTSPQGIDSANGLADIQAKTAQTGSTTVTLGGVQVVFTTQDFQTLSPRELRLKVFRTFATELYDKGAYGLAKSQGQDETTARKFENDATLISTLGSAMHARISGIFIGFVVADLVALAGVVLFSHRFGRLVSPGVVFLLVGLPGIIFAAAASHAYVSGSPLATGDTTDMSTAFGALASYITPLILPHVAGVYMAALGLGTALLVASGVGKLVYMLVRRGQHEGVHQKRSDKA
jgi:hypothetical protein